MNRLKFVSGDDNVYKTQNLKTRKGKIIFRSGDCESDAIDDEKQILDLKESFNNPLNLEQMLSKQRAKKSSQEHKTLQKPSELADRIYNRLLVLNLLYQNLNRLSPHQEFIELSGELNVITYAASQIVLKFSKQLPRQTEKFETFYDFCQGKDYTEKYICQIQSDLRKLLFINEDKEIDLQLIVINMSLQGQSEELKNIEKCS